MSVDDYGSVWCIDHCLPIASFSLLVDNETGKCSGWINLTLMYIKENTSRRAKTAHQMNLFQHNKAYQFVRKNEEELNQDFFVELYSTPPKKRFSTNKTKYTHIDDIWSIDQTVMSDSKVLNNNGFRYIFVKLDNFSKNTWRITLKNKNAQTKTDK